MHFDAFPGLVVARFVLELLQIKVPVERSIDAGKKIQVKDRSQPHSIVVCRQHLIEILHEIGTQQEDVTRLEKFSNSAKE